MAINYNLVSEKVFNLLRGNGFEVQAYNKEGEIVVNPQEATRFLTQRPNILVRLDRTKEEISLSVGKQLDDDGIRTSLKELAQDNLMSFDFRIFDKKLQPKGEKIDIAKKSEKFMNQEGKFSAHAVLEASASLGKMTGSRKSSYQPLADNVKIIVRHNSEVNEEVRGSRSRNIHSILIQRGEEKFKMAENNLTAARAMARHLHNGGETFDPIGESITSMAKDFGKLKEFVRYVRSTNLVNETNQEFVDLAFENIEHIKTNLKRLSGVKSYANACETVTDYNNVELLQDDLDLESKFTETHFDDKVANVMDNIKAMASRKTAFETKITKAISLESFTGVKGLLSEDEGMDFATPEAKLGHQVSQLGYTAKDKTLGNYLHSISSKLNAGGQLNQFEYGAIKSSLLSANQYNESIQVESAEDSYEAFINQFVEE